MDENDRQERAKDLSQERPQQRRSARADELEDQRLERAQRLAVEAALKAQRVDDRLDGHDAHLLVINGSIEGTRRELSRMNDGFVEAREESRKAIKAVSDQCTSIATDRDKERAVREALLQAVKQANEKQISSRQFWVGVAAIIVTVLLAILAQGHLFG